MSSSDTTDDDNEKVDVYTFEISMDEIQTLSTRHTPWETVFRKAMMWEAMAAFIEDKPGWTIEKRTLGKRGIVLVVTAPRAAAKAEWESHVPTSVARPKGLR